MRLYKIRTEEKFRTYEIVTYKSVCVNIKLQNNKTGKQ